MSIIENVRAAFEMTSASLMITLWPAYEDEMERKLHQSLSAPGLTDADIRKIGQKYESDWLHMTETGRSIWVEEQRRRLDAC